MDIRTAKAIAAEAAIDSVFAIIDQAIEMLDSVEDETALAVREMLDMAQGICANRGFSHSLEKDVFRSLEVKAKNHGWMIKEDNAAFYSVINPVTRENVSDRSMTLSQLSEWLDNQKSLPNITGSVSVG